LYSTYLGGNSFDTLSAIAVDSTGNIYAAGFTTSPNFPVKNSLVAFPAASGSPFSWLSYGFLTKIGPDGQSLVYSTLIGGSHGYDLVWGMAFAPSGGVYLIGGTDDADFPTMNAFQGTIGGVGPSGIPSSYGDNVFLVRIDDGPGDTATPYTQAPMANLTASPNFQMFTLAQNGSMGTAAFSVTSSAAATAFAARASVMPTYVNGALTSSNFRNRPGTTHHDRRPHRHASRLIQRHHLGNACVRRAGHRRCHHACVPQWLHCYPVGRAFLTRIFGPSERGCGLADGHPE
jgi:hypothetical protein